jgi:hypothetical protein
MRAFDRSAAIRNMFTDQEEGSGSTTKLYRFYDASGDLLYVGITGTLSVRMEAHRRESPWWREAEFVSIESYANWDFKPWSAEARKAESHAIRTEYPKYNKTGWPDLDTLLTDPELAAELIKRRTSVEYAQRLTELLSLSLLPVAEAD